MGDNVMEMLDECLETANDLSDDQTEQQMVELQEMTKDTSTLLIQTAQKFRQTADTLDYLWKTCQKVRIGGTSVGILGGILAICGGVSMLMSGGATTPLLLFGSSFGFAGAGTNIVATFIKVVMDSNEIKKAETDLKEISNKIKDLETNLQARMSKLSLVVDIIHFFRRTIFYGGVAIFSKRQATGAAAQVTAKEGAKAGAQAADDIAGVAAKAGAQAADDIAGGAAKAGTQAADDVAGASFKAGANGGAKLVGKVIILASAVTLTLDVIDLSCAIKDFVNEKGSDAAKILRAKADELDKIKDTLFKLNGKLFY